MSFQIIQKMMDTTFHQTSVQKVSNILFLTGKDLKRITILIYFYPTKQESALISCLLMN